MVYMIIIHYARIPRKWGNYSPHTPCEGFNPSRSRVAFRAVSSPLHRSVAAGSPTARLLLITS